MANDVLPFKYALKEAPKQKTIKIAVALVSHEMVPFGFSYDLAAMTMHSVAMLGERTVESQQRGDPEIEVWEYGIEAVKGTYVHSARQELLQRMLARKVDYILWIDTDMRFPRDALMRLLARDLPVVGINYCQRGEPYDFVALKKISWDKNGITERCETLQDSTGVEEVEGIGFGMVLMKTEILTCLPDLDYTPWFWFEWLPGQRQVGEDIYFCRLLRDGGHKIYVDHSLSQVCAHIGQAEYEPIHAERYGRSTKRKADTESVS